MFRRKPKNHLKEMEEWPTTLEAYGTFLNSKDQIRLIVRPEEKMVYKVSSSREYNDRRLAAFRRVLSGIAVERLETLGMRRLKVPLGVAEDDPHTVILVSNDFETNKEKLAVLIPFADELGMWASRVMDEESVHTGSLEDATKTLLQHGYAVVALNPRQTFWDSVRKTQLSYMEARYSRRKFKLVPDNGDSEQHIKYVMEKVVPMSPSQNLFIFSHWGSCREILEYLNLSYDTKWEKKLVALGMAQGAMPMECITSAKFRVFLAEKALNYVYISNVAANIRLRNNNIGCPNISFGPDCEYYEYMATRTLDKIIRFFEGGQEAILCETIVEQAADENDDLDTLGNWNSLKENLEDGGIVRLLEVGIGAGEDDSEWFRK